VSSKSVENPLKLQADFVNQAKGEVLKNSFRLVVKPIIIAIDCKLPPFQINFLDKFPDLLHETHNNILTTLYNTSTRRYKKPSKYSIINMLIPIKQQK